MFCFLSPVVFCRMIVSGPTTCAPLLIYNIYKFIASQASLATWLNKREFSVTVKKATIKISEFLWIWRTFESLLTLSDEKDYQET